MNLPLHHQHTALGATFEARNLPAHYGDWRAEHAAVRDSVGLIDLSDLGRLRGSGPDIGQVLHGVVTNEVKHLPVGAGCHAALLNDVGRAQTLLAILRVEDGYLIETPRGLAERSRDLVDYYIITEDAEIADVSPEWGQLSVQGPQSRAVLESLLEVAPPAVELPEFAHVAARMGGHTVHVVRRNRTGEDGYDVWVRAPALADAWSLLHDAVTKAGGRAVGREALDVLRIEASIPEYGVDLDENTIPLETGLFHAISENKGCYLGQEIIARIVNLSKPVRSFVGLFTPEEVRPDARLLKGEKEVGRVTSATTSPTLGRPIALAYIRTDLLNRGVDEVRLNGQPFELHPAPFYRSERAPVAVVPPSPTAGKLIPGIGL